jgi:Glycosyltransferases involved in cell wall biogenesis
MEKYLSECLESVFKQTLKEKEIICINDGSTDRSLDILNIYKNKYDNMVLINNENHGVAYSRNYGMKIAKGKYCCFIDPDDIYPEEDVLEYLYSQICRQKAFICGGSSILFRDGIQVDNLTGADLKYRFCENSMTDYVDYQYSYGFWRFMYDLEFLKANDIYFPLYCQYEDPPFLVKAMICAKQFYAVSKNTYVYRYVSKTKIFTYEKTYDCLMGFIDVLKMSRTNNLMTLHQDTINHINTWFAEPLFWYIQKENNDLLKLLEYAKQEADDQYRVGTRFFEVENWIDKIDILKQKKKEFQTIVCRYPKIIIYGAGYVGKKVGDYLINTLDKNRLVYAVTHNNAEENNYKGILIKEINELSELSKRDTIVLIATLHNLQEEIRRILMEYDFNNVFKIDYSEFRFFSLIQ